MRAVAASSSRAPPNTARTRSNTVSLSLSALLVTTSALITLVVSPNLNLVSLRYEEGDLISQDIVITDNVALVDERSTAARRAEALDGFAPIYDNDDKLKLTVFER